MSPDTCLRCPLSDVFALHSRALPGELRMKSGAVPGGLGQSRLWPGFRRSGTIISPPPSVFTLWSVDSTRSGVSPSRFVSDLRKSSLFAPMTPLVAGWASSPDRIPLRPSRLDALACRGRRIVLVWPTSSRLPLTEHAVATLALVGRMVDDRICLALLRGPVPGVQNPFGSQMRSHRPTRPRDSGHSPTGHIKDAGQVHEPRQARLGRTTRLRIAWAGDSDSQANSSGICPLRTNSTIWRRRLRGYRGFDFLTVDTTFPKGQVSPKSCQLHQSEASSDFFRNCHADLRTEGYSDRCVDERVPPTPYCCSRESEPSNNPISSPCHFHDTKAWHGTGPDHLYR